MSVESINHIFRSLEKHFTSAIPSCTDTAHKPYMTSQGQEHAPHAGLGSVEAGPIVRYWTVKFRHGGSVLWDYTHVIACDPFRASLVVTNRDRSIAEAVPVREIQRDEFEALTRSSP